MPLHDWTRVEAGIFHAFHHRWISAISDVLNEGILLGDPLPEMPLFLKPNACVTLPLESTYLTAFAAQPSRWRQVLEQEH